MGAPLLPSIAPFVRVPVPGCATLQSQISRPLEDAGALMYKGHDLESALPDVRFLPGKIGDNREGRILMTEELKARFERAAENVTKMSKRPDGPNLLKLYSLYKQAMEGDNKGGRPGLMDFVGRAKYDAWKALAGTSKEEAMRQYAEFAESLVVADKQQ